MIVQHVVGFKQNVPGHNLETEWIELDPRVRTLVILAGTYSIATYGLLAIVTSLLRSSVEQQAANPASLGLGPHRWGLAADLRVRHAPDPEAYGRALVAWLTDRVEYRGKPGATVAILEGTGPSSTGPHVHVQVPGPRTRTGRLLAVRLVELGGDGSTPAA